MRPTRPSWQPAAALAVVLAGCSSTSFSGRVTDVTGAPLPDSRVTAVGTLCQGPTDADGQFHLKCNTHGEVRLVVTQSGYVSKEVPLTVDAVQDYDLGQVSLIRIPDGDGLFLFDGASYATMAPGYLERHMDGFKEPHDKAYCLDRDASTPNKVAAGPVPIYEKSASDDWKLFKLDDEGCARRMKREGSTWSITWSEKPDMTSLDVEYEQAVHVAQLPPGEYFLAWWRGGTFVATDGGGDDGARFAGYWLVSG